MDSSANDSSIGLIENSKEAQRLNDASVDEQINHRNMENLVELIENN